MDITKHNNDGVSFEKYYPVYNDQEKGVTLRPYGQIAEFGFFFDRKPNKTYRLFTAGQTTLYYYWKSEPGYPAQYHAITDSLDTEHAYKAQYCLDFSSAKPEPFVKRVHKQIDWKPMVWYIPLGPVPTVFKAGVFARGNNVKVEKDGYLRMRIDVRVKAESYETPEYSYLIDLPQGNYKWTEICQDIEIPLDAKCVYCFVEGKKYQGEVYIETPFLKGEGQNLLCDFTSAVPNMTRFDWTGQYVSKKEWPIFEIKLNGKTFYKGEIFERCHACSDWSVNIPAKLLKKKNKISYRLLSKYHDPLPYTLHEIAVVEQPAGELAMVACAKEASTVEKARVLVRTDRPNVKVTLTCQSDAIQGESEYFFEEAGLHGIALTCLKPAFNASFILSTENSQVQGVIERIAEKSQDNVYAGTGDMVYITQTKECVEEYLSWYISNAVGQLITVRPTYRWSGSRAINPEVWKIFNRIVNELDMKYVLMFDGREANGYDTQPTDTMLQGKGYMGSQRHETDGANGYSAAIAPATDPYVRARAQLLTEIRRENPEHTNPVDHKTWKNQAEYFKKIARREPIDLKWRKENVENILDGYRGGRATRHTGVTPYFKYFLESGYEWVGAETMYSTHEQILSFLRGACKNAGKDIYGVHNAVQWSTCPHDTPDRFRRYRLALYDSYILGVSDINTEEGLWRIEEYWARFNRFSTACVGHLKEHQDFTSYVATHTRSGKFYTPVAFMHGRLDGSVLFVEHRTWGLPDHVTNAERSWGMMRAFYPLAERNCLYKKPDCSSTTPQGYYSGTPLGCVDAIPAEGNYETLNSYRTVAFAGYHAFEKEDLEKWQKFANEGGRVALTLAHFTETTIADELKKDNLTLSKEVENFTQGTPKFITATKDGVEFRYCENMKLDGAKVLAETDDNRPLVLAYPFGKGEIIIVAAKEYPAHKAIANIYKTLLEQIGKETFDEEYVWAKADEKVTFVVYNQEDGSRHIYFLAVDWYNDPALIRKATLRIGKNEYGVEMPFGELIKCVVNGESFAYPKSEKAEVLKVEENSFTAQGVGVVEFVCGKNGEQKTIAVDFANAPVQTVEM